MKFRVKDFDFKIQPQIVQMGRENFLELNRWKKKPKAQRAKASYEDIIYIKRLRTQAKTDTDQVKVSITHKRTKVGREFFLRSGWVKSYDVYLSVVRAAVMEHRVQLRQRKTEARHGYGTIYHTVAGVHPTGGRITDLYRTSPINNISAVKIPMSKTTNYVGIELEFNDHPVVTIAAIQKALDPFKKHCQLTRDGSCGHELRVLLPESEVETKLPKIMNALRDLGLQCDNRCGGHVHFDMRNRDHKRVFKNLVRSLGVMQRLVAKERIGNRFCMPNQTDEFDLEAKGRERYLMVNPHSFARHGTIEVRLHQGTLVADEMVTWIKFLLKIINYTGEITRRLEHGNNLYEFIEFSDEEKQTLRNRHATIQGNLLLAWIG